jgi:Ribbon-helix-helix protein, copG family
MTLPARGPCNRIHPYIPRELDDRLTKFRCAAGITESAVVEAALRQYLDGTSELTVLLRRLDRQAKALESVHSDLAFLAETFAVYVKFWFAHTPSIAPEQRKGAQRSAEDRYRHFMDYVAAQYAQGQRLVSDPPREPLTDEEPSATSHTEVPDGALSASD